MFVFWEREKEVRQEDWMFNMLYKLAQFTHPSHGGLILLLYFFWMLGHCRWFDSSLDDGFTTVTSDWWIKCFLDLSWPHIFLLLLALHYVRVLHSFWDGSFTLKFQLCFLCHSHRWKSSHFLSVSGWWCKSQSYDSAAQLSWCVKGVNLKIKCK